MTSTSLSSTTPVRRFGGAADIMLAAALWGTTGTVRSFVHASPVAVGAARLLIGGAVLFALALRSGGLRPLLDGGRRTRLILLLGAVLAAVYQVAFFSAVARTGVATGTVVTIGSGPVFAGLLSWLLRMGAPTRRWLLSTAGAVAGCAALTAGGRSAGVEPLGIALALLSGFGYAAYATVASSLITRGENDRAVVGALFGGAGLLLLPVLLAYGPGWLLTGQGGPAALYLGLVTTGVGYVLYGRGLRTTPVAVATTLTLAEPAVAAVLGLVVLGEHLGTVALGGLALLVLSLLVLALPVRG
ncbi:EamA family transporter [Actinomadura sp. DC4]|uniref:EamA family transporter n=1 Tax=Actinomadura sp. DC4 TaxID=3055069 RepID=UPI0025B24B9E|nr:EamA family transporter [Actinomadura sp. DC4]MDN3358445.1 EamA family transporter [Actinomadura sp. DC4]